MKLQMEKGTSLALTLLLLASFVAIGIPGVRAQATSISLVPTPQTVTTVGDLVSFSCLIEDITDLYGLAIEIQWDTSYLTYHSHVFTVPIDDTPPYPGGVLYAAVFTLADDPDIPAGKYNCDVSSLAPAPSFNGTGTVFNITLEVVAVPWDFEIAPDPYLESNVNFTTHSLANSGATAIPHACNNGTVRLMGKTFEYPPEPLLKVLLEGSETYSPGAIGAVFDADVWLMGDGEVDLDPFWDVAGIDVYMHFNDTMLAPGVITIDPDGEFESFFDLGLFEIAKNITPGMIHVAFIGYGTHDPPFGQIRMFTVNFTALTESETFPTPCSPIYLENPVTYTGSFVFDSIGGLININSPMGTDWFQLTPGFGTNVPHTMTAWTDNGDGELGASDQIKLQGLDGHYAEYHVDSITGTLNVTMQWYGFPTELELTHSGWAMDGYRPYFNNLWSTPAQFSGLGNPGMTDPFALFLPVASVSNFTVIPQIGSPYQLVEGTDFVILPDGTIQLNATLDHAVPTEFYTMPLFPAGYPFIDYIASGFWNTSIWLDFPNGTSRYARGGPYRAAPPTEYWYEPYWPNEFESWYATDPLDPAAWPTGTNVTIDYPAASQVEISYFGVADPNPRYIEFDGSYADFLTALSNPNGSIFLEVYPFSLRDPYDIFNWSDEDSSSDLTPGDLIGINASDGYWTFLVNDITTDILVQRKPYICTDDPSDDYYGWKPIVSVSGWPHDERDMCPWHNAPYSISLPHVVEDALYCEPYAPTGGFIDVWTQYPDPFGGQGYSNPSDMFWPQKELHLCVNVTYAGWPEQNKDVAFQVIDPHGVTWGIYVNRTNTVGRTCVRVRLPWPCDDPEYYFGIWTVIATVDVACVVVNDTLQFKYDYKVRIWDASLDKTEYKHCEDIEVTINYGTWATQFYNITFAITAVDGSGVPFDFDFGEVTIGWGDHTKWCLYKNGTIVLTVHVEKFARPALGTIYIVALSDLPANGGSAESPVLALTFGILPEWA